MELLSFYFLYRYSMFPSDSVVPVRIQFALQA